MKVTKEKVDFPIKQMFNSPTCLGSVVFSDRFWGKDLSFVGFNTA